MPTSPSNHSLILEETITASTSGQTQRTNMQAPTLQAITTALALVNSLPTPTESHASQFDEELSEAFNLDFTLPPLAPLGLPNFSQRAPDSPPSSVSLDDPPQDSPPEYVPMRDAPPQTSSHAALSAEEDRLFLTRFWRNVQRRQWARGTRDAALEPTPSGSESSSSSSSELWSEP
ncbi:hypothetical protein BU25DRAFT_486611 [Macroventuria anomochaeta]|uniref:Uncharacterized protein n=1 Tax=Macroventuria anomochaeta TaxID=301207 RepID=A0ACB6SHT1_9PLEO|nr:uncharacterized protein BU25DRAFT_486611 [Macroventuria anomochaeta]KAF2633543.1 hypothetical protein BU25DRAFT_486611 [Macroventuria anomochaeta]